MARWHRFRSDRMRNDFENLKTEEIVSEINERLRMKVQMVGWLYPSILQAEIEKLRMLYGERMLHPEHLKK